MELIKKKLREHCEQYNCVFIEAEFISSDAPRIWLELEPFMLAIRAEVPRAVYYYEDIFDIDDFIESEMQQLGWKPGFEDHPDTVWLGPEQVKLALIDYLKQFEQCAETAYQLVAVFPSNGVFCTVSLRAPWATEIEDMIDSLIESRQDDVTATMKISESEDAQLLQNIVVELVANEMFAKTRGLNKRLLLATKLVGDRIPRHPDGRVTKLAQNGNYCDANLAMVVKAADEKIWLETALPSENI